VLSVVVTSGVVVAKAVVEVVKAVVEVVKAVVVISKDNFTVEAVVAVVDSSIIDVVIVISWELNDDVSCPQVEVTSNFFSSEQVK
jgi:hypothetical protein